VNYTTTKRVYVVALRRTIRNMNRARKSDDKPHHSMARVSAPIATSICTKRSLRHCAQEGNVTGTEMSWPLSVVQSWRFDELKFQ
jgi:hypothetical protein